METNYGIKFQIFPTDEQVEKLELWMDKTRSFWNILLFEQSRGLWLKKNEEHDLFNVKYADTVPPKDSVTEKEHKKLNSAAWKLCRTEWQELNPTFFDVWYGCGKTVKVIHEEMGFYTDNQTKKIAKDMKDSGSTVDEIKKHYEYFIKGKTNIKYQTADQYQHIQDELSKRVDRYDVFKGAARTNLGMGNKFDSCYAYGTNRIYKDNEYAVQLPSAVALGVTKSIHQAWSDFKWVEGNFPNFKEKGSVKSISMQSGNYSSVLKQLPDEAGLVDIKVPVIGNIAVNIHEVFNVDKVCYLTFSKEGRSWYISLNVMGDKPANKFKHDKAIGVDMGCTTLITGVDEDGKIITLKKVDKVIKRLATLEVRKIRQQKHMSKLMHYSKRDDKPLSKNYSRAKEDHAITTTKINRINKNLRHWVSNVLTKKYGHIILEDLKVKEMTKADKKYKSNLNKNILSQGWYNIIQMVEYKAKWRGNTVTKINPAYTSQECSNCGHIEKDNRKTQANFCCLSCGHSENADVNASNNILRIGLEEYANKLQNDVDTKTKVV
jgi:IS605 OrfB family transposase